MPTVLAAQKPYYACFRQPDTEYRALSAADIDLDFCIRTPLDTVLQHLRLIQKPNVGGRLQIRLAGGRSEFLSQSVVPGRTARSFQAPASPQAVYAVVADFYLRYREQTDSAFSARYPETIQKWPIIIPQLVIKSS